MTQLNTAIMNTAAVLGTTTLVALMSLSTAGVISWAF